MSLRTLFFLLICAAIATFVGVNWTEMNRPTDLSLIFTHVTAPLGLVLVGLMVLLFVVFVGVMAYTQGTVLMETRRHAKELSAQRELADSFSDEAIVATIFPTRRNLASIAACQGAVETNQK